MSQPRSTPRSLRAALIAGIVLGSLACSSSGDGAPDMGTPLDGAAPDGGSADLAVGDQGTTTDSGAPDLGPSACTDPFTTISNPPGAPPYSGTAFITDGLIQSSDPTAFVDLTPTGQGSRQMFDRRANAFVTLNAHLFDAQFGTGTTVEIQVNPEFSATEAEAEARKYAAVIGRLPAFLFRDIDTVWIHAGTEPFGGGNRNLLIHTGQGEAYETGGELEEILIHEAAHTSMDAYHASATRWLMAQQADGVALSTYARDNPTREDVAESLGPYLAARLRPGRIDTATRTTIEGAIPNRMQYFDCLGLTMGILE